MCIIVQFIDMRIVGKHNLFNCAAAAVRKLLLKKEKKAYSNNFFGTNLI